MGIVSFEYIIFIFVGLSLFFLSPPKWRWVTLFATSILFIILTGNASQIWFCLVTILSTYVISFFIHTAGGKKRTAILILGVFLNCLFFFAARYLYTGKYLGASYYLLQNISYLAGVYRKKIVFESHLGIFSLYTLFFPRFLSGPIEPPVFLRQFLQNHRFSSAATVDGLKIIIWGIFKKAVIADRLAIYVNEVFGNPTNFKGVALMIAIFFFSIEIYADFSAYSDMAVGAGQILGFKLTNNFNSPYRAQSFSDFWKKWNISLSAWLKNYIYIPLGGNRIGALRQNLNVIAVFFVSGLWHGSKPTLIIWGLLNATFLIMERYLVRFKFREIPGFIRQTLVFILVCFAWIFFRAENLKDVGYIFSHLFDNIFPLFITLLTSWRQLGQGQGVLRPLLFGNYQLNQTPSEFLISFILIGACFILPKFMVSQKKCARIFAMYAVVAGIILFGMDSQTQFIYSQF